MNNDYRLNKVSPTHEQQEYDVFDINQKLVMNLCDVGHTVRFLFEGKGSQKRILIILNETGTMTQQALTKRLGVQPGSASEVIGKLESAGLIQRQMNENDHRTTDIQLTELGKQKAQIAFQQRQQRHQDMFRCLSDEDKQVFLTLLEKLNDDWDIRYRNKKDKHKRKYYHR